VGAGHRRAAGYGIFGISAPLALMASRCLQGFSLGGESTSARPMAMECAPPHRRAFYGSLVNPSAPVGLSLVTLTLVGIRAWSGEGAFLQWVWRIADKHSYVG